MTQFWCEAAWRGGSVTNGLLIESDSTGTISAVTTSTQCPPTATRLQGLTFPGLANTHSHAFHRALRGRVNDHSFWAWRDAMYRVAQLLDPDNYQRLATAVFAEMALAGFTAVGEFHYVHHQSGGRPYDEVNSMGEALMQAAAVAGIRLTLLDTCYLQGGIDQELALPQQRFADAGFESWSERRGLLKAGPLLRIGAAIHSIRAVPRSALSPIAAASHGGPLHVHLSEQVAENEQSLAAYGLTPTRVFAEEGVLGEDLTAIHAIHLQPGDVAELAMSGTTVCACPTTEADLGDGIGPFAELHERAVPLTIGTDQHVHVDPFLEIQRLELDQRLHLARRSVFTAEDLMAALTVHGYRSLGWPKGGSFDVGGSCDLVSIRTDSIRAAGMGQPEMALAASSADVDTVVVGGRTIVSQGQHLLGDVPAMLKEAIAPLWA